MDSTPALRIDGAVATIELRRPARANRLADVDLATLREHLAAVDAASDVLVLCLEAQGPQFCAGYDLVALASGACDGIDAFADVADRLEQCRAVTVAVIDGGVYGGATDLCLACDFRIGSDRSALRMPAARLGVHLYEGGLARYVSRLGVDVAKRLLLACDPFDAQQMRDCEFLTELVASDALIARRDALVAGLAGMAPLALLPMKRHLNDLARGCLDRASLDDDLARARVSADAREGVAAWHERRAPRFTAT